MAREQAQLATLEQLRRRKSLPWYLDVMVRLVKTKPLGTVGLALVLLLVLMAVMADVVAPYTYDEQNLLASFIAPSGAHPFGTDHAGRDVMSRVMYGARISMYVSLIALTIAKVGSVTLGLVTGYFGGKLDTILQRFVDAWMSFPGFIILLSLMAIMKPGIVTVAFALGIGGIFGSSRVIRSQVLTVKENQYVEAARAVGASHLRIIMLYILPNCMAPIIISATLALGAYILAESSLSFLGLGIPPPHPSWGQMLAGLGITYMQEAPWVVIFPGLAISLAVFGFNMLGDALRDLLDPRLRGTQ